MDLDLSTDLASTGDPLAEQIARAIEEDIVFGRLKPGQKLPEEDLAERFAASRHQVREGLARLSRMGIVTKERNRGVSVRRFSVDEVRQIYEVREILQRQAALRIPLPVDEPKITALAAINDDYERAVAAGDLRRIHAANDLFHLEIFRLCGNERLLSLVKHYMDLTYAVRAAGFSDPENLETSRRHHRIMIRLLRGKDSWALAQICVDHIQPTKTQYLAVLDDRETMNDLP
ncbi:transcriptional regulator, GntR family [Rhizobiales bacterium GAS188]|nr:transcriptional regulator, GntR family [Rhizobiales bacterium GAS188]